MSRKCVNTEASENVIELTIRAEKIGVVGKTHDGYQGIFKGKLSQDFFLLKEIKIRSGYVRIKEIFRTLVRRHLGTITHVDTKEPVAALTFDDGPHAVYTRNLLEILERYKARATFFMVGEAAQRQPALVRGIAQAGHAIGIHSWDHPSFTRIGGRERRRQLRLCEGALGAYGQRLFRPPWGKQSVASRLDALWLGYKVIGWNVIGEDWLHLAGADLAERLIREISPGSIILLHDAIYRSVLPVPQYDRSAMLEGLELALKEVGNRFRFITVPELLRRGRPVLEEWFYK